MLKKFPALLACALLALAACKARVTTVPPPAAAPPAGSGWRAEAAPEDAARIDNVALAWRRALENARKAGFAKQLSAEKSLLDPGGGLAFPAPSPGSYMCRAVKLAPSVRGQRAFQAFKPFFCFVGAEGDRLFLTKQTGTERPSGYLWGGAGTRSLVFLGSMAAAASDPAIPYGSDRSRDLAGLFERIGPLRFRLVIPHQVAQGRLDVFELVPAPVQHEE